MSETAAAAPANTEVKTPGKIVSVGKVEKMAPPYVSRGTEGSETSEVTENGEPAAAADQNPATPAANAAAPDTNNQSGANPPTGEGKPPVELSNEQLKAYFEQQGIPFESIDKLKEKLSTPASPAAPLTDEQKAKIEKEKEDRIVNAHLARNGTVEQLATFKSVIAAAKKDLGLQKEIEDLVADGFSKEKAEEMAKDRYFQYTDEEIAAIDDEEMKKETIKKREIGLKKLENKGGYLQQRAQGYLKILEKELEAADAEKIKMEQHSSKVEDAIKKFQRKEVLKLGELDGVEIPSIDFEYSDTALNSAKELLRDGAKFDEQLFNNEGELNIDFILPHLVKSFSMDEAVKKSYLTGQDRAVEKFQSKFGATPPPLGGNGKPKGGTPGKIVGVGERQVFKPAYKK